MNEDKNQYEFIFSNEDIINIDLSDTTTIWSIANGTSIDVSYHTVEWKDSMPDVGKIEDMCKEYPALERAYENFKSIYKMVEQDWNGKQKDREDPPF